jgi:hypothetical protein
VDGGGSGARHVLMGQVFEGLGLWLARADAQVQYAPPGFERKWRCGAVFTRRCLA